MQPPTVGSSPLNVDRLNCMSPSARDRVVSSRCTPRLSLRRLATYRAVACLLLLYIVLFAWRNAGLFEYSVVVFTIFLLYFVIKTIVSEPPPAVAIISSAQRCEQWVCRYCVMRWVCRHWDDVWCGGDVFSGARFALIDELDLIKIWILSITHVWLCKPMHMNTSLCGWAFFNSVVFLRGPRPLPLQNHLRQWPSKGNWFPERGEKGCPTY